MHDQATLPFPVTKPTLRDLAAAWMRDNPDAMGHFRRFAETMRAADRRFGMKLLAERVRWEMELAGASDFKINNSHVAYIGRRLVAEDPRLANLIRCRRTPAADRPAREPRVADGVDPRQEANG